MRIKGLVSVVLPTKDRANWLPERLNELLGQSYQKTEIIVILDGCTDNSDKILYEYRNEPKIKVITLEKNSGSCSIPRNIAVSWSNGEYISPCDDDVYDEKDKLEFLVDTLNKNPDAVLAYGKRKDWIGGIIHERVIENWNPTLPNGWGIDNSQILYRSNVYTKIPFLYFIRACDYNLARKLYELGRFVYVPRFTSTYVFHNSNRSNIKISDNEQIGLNKQLEEKAKGEFAKYFNENFLKTFE